MTGAVTRQQYWPYGAARSGALTQTDKLYTGQQQEPGDAALGLYNYRARFYSTITGRFVSADVVNDGPNRYMYVRDNPLRYIDPSGECFALPNGKQVTETCTENDVKTWLACALGACSSSPALQELARVGINEAGFWKNVRTLWGEARKAGREDVFFVDVIGTIARTATSDSFDEISSAGFEQLAGMAGMEARGAFLRASLHDLLFGSSWISNANEVSDAEFIGGDAWWNTFGWIIAARHVSLSGDYARNAETQLRDRTLALGRELSVKGFDVNAYPWSPYQWETLAANVPGVVEPQDISRCFDDPGCWQAWLRAWGRSPRVPGESDLP